MSKVSEPPFPEMPPSVSSPHQSQPTTAEERLLMEAMGGQGGLPAARLAGRTTVLKDPVSKLISSLIAAGIPIDAAHTGAQSINISYLDLIGEHVAGILSLGHDPEAQHVAMERGHEAIHGLGAMDERSRDGYRILMERWSPVVRIPHGNGHVFANNTTVHVTGVTTPAQAQTIFQRLVSQHAIPQKLLQHPLQVPSAKTQQQSLVSQKKGQGLAAQFAAQMGQVADEIALESKAGQEAPSSASISEEPSTSTSPSKHKPLSEEAHDASSVFESFSGRKKKGPEVKDPLLRQKELQREEAAHLKLLKKGEKAKDIASSETKKAEQRTALLKAPPKVQ